MRVPLSWLRELVDPGLPAEQLARRLSGSGTLVEAIHHARNRCAAIVINPGAFANYTLAGFEAQYGTTASGNAWGDPQVWDGYGGDLRVGPGSAARGIGMDVGAGAGVDVGAHAYRPRWRYAYPPLLRPREYAT